MATNSAHQLYFPSSGVNHGGQVSGPPSGPDGKGNVWIQGFSFGDPRFVGDRSGNTGNAFSSGGDLYDQIARITAQNNSWSAQQAQKQMDYQTASQRTAMEFNSAEAAKNRKWQEYMSNTAHQREVADLKAAGLNPILSASGGNGAAVTSGATAAGASGQAGSRGDTDTSGTMALVNFLGSMLQANTQLQAMQTSALSNLAVADKYTQMSRLTTQMQTSTQERIAQLSAGAQLTSTEMYTMASRYAAEVGADATKVMAAIQAAASRANAIVSSETSKYGFNKQAETSKYLAILNNDVNLRLARMGYQHDFDLKEFYPSPWQVSGEIFDNFRTGVENTASSIGKWFDRFADQVTSTWAKKNASRD